MAAETQTQAQGAAQAAEGEQELSLLDQAIGATKQTDANEAQDLLAALDGCQFSVDQLFALFKALFGIAAFLALFVEILVEIAASLELLLGGFRLDF